MGKVYEMPDLEDVEAVIEKLSEYDCRLMYNFGTANFEVWEGEESGGTLKASFFHIWEMQHIAWLYGMLKDIFDEESELESEEHLVVWERKNTFSWYGIVKNLGRFFIDPVYGGYSASWRRLDHQEFVTLHTENGDPVWDDINSLKRAAEDYAREELVSSHTR